MSDAQKPPSEPDVSEREHQTAIPSARGSAGMEQPDRRATTSDRSSRSETSGEAPKPHTAPDIAERLEWTRSELGKPGRNTFWPDDIEFLLGVIDGLVEQLEGAEYRESKLRHQFDGLVEQLEALREASDTARGWLYHGLNGGGMKSARKAFDVLDAEFHAKEPDA